VLLLLVCICIQTLPDSTENSYLDFINAARKLLVKDPTSMLTGTNSSSDSSSNSSSVASKTRQQQQQQQQQLQQQRRYSSTDSRSQREDATLRLSMIAVTALLIESSVSGNDALGHAMGLF
jgi:hypothetical protein